MFQHCVKGPEGTCVTPEADRRLYLPHGEAAEVSAVKEPRRWALKGVLDPV